MKIIKKGTAILTLAALVGFTPTFAQSDAATGGPTTAATTEEDRPNYTPLLGLLGLLGLMGLKRRNDTRDFNNDARR